ncbi:acyl-protein synthetase [Kurthia zopfii]|uniref:Acyl-protein synthetase LuxE n=1 Tax=Kurthia zopfii TaxID=1650 RepID=A0A8B4Q7Q7_9BACL|nr:acyl-protein synthetase [Kurthia zopfii]PWI22640.1 acyl-protein synthetase [Kurthia zopfii]TDR39258.1 acyl-protein synthetase LuxE [Kurthia zopfii]GEK31512.1 acyl-protein synthetase [Kurthia zopfii]STX08803.1 Acyl-protein synthetase, LuxE [Kurthia zopfii]
MKEPFHLEKTEKEIILLEKLNELSELHFNACEAYSKMIKKSEQEIIAKSIIDVPFLPVQLFKSMELKSIPDEEVVKVLTSSGTSGQTVSKIYLDKNTAISQTKALVSLMKPVLGEKRLPMIILDTKSVLKNRKSFSARGAGIIGFSNFGRKHFYALNDDMTLDYDGLKKFMDEFGHQKILMFGFTFMIWKYVFKKLKEQRIKLDFNNAILIHGGGWKKLSDEAIDSLSFNQQIKEQLGISEIHNYYGMVEQVGSIFIECKEGYLHSPSYADVIIRDPISFENVRNGVLGLIQVVSELPRSYPGHSLLTEDLGTIIGEDNCKCGWKGKYFTVLGRIPKAEIRGCSDTFQEGE